MSSLALHAICLVALLAAMPAAAQQPPAPAATLANYKTARAIVDRAVAALGGADAIDRAGGLALEGEGTLDLGTRLQGRRPFEGDTYPIVERIAIVPGDDRLVHEERSPINPDAWSWQRVDYRASGTYRIDMEARRASWTRPASSDHIRRTIPLLLLREIQANPATLRSLGRVTVSGMPRDAVSWHAPDRGVVTLLFDPDTHLLREVEAIADLPVRGDAAIRWSFSDYSHVPNVGPFPGGYTIDVDGERFRDVHWVRRAAAPSGGVLDPPAGITLPAATPFEPPPVQDAAPASAPEFDIRDLAPGVHLLVNLRLGFHMLFVDFPDFVVAVDAPSGWWELHELPPRNWARLASPDLGERYVAAIRSRVGDKPIRYVVLTHHHGDHAGGVRAFVEARATVVGAALTRQVVERTLAGSLSLARTTSTPAPPLTYDVVDGTRTIANGGMTMQVIDVGENPHAEGMLAVWLPDARLLYVSDLFVPWSATGSPPRDRLPVMRWFVGWLDRSGLNPERIYAIHGAARVTDAHLAEIRRGMDDQ